MAISIPIPPYLKAAQAPTGLAALLGGVQQGIGAGQAFREKQQQMQQQKEEFPLHEQLIKAQISKLQQQSKMGGIPLTGEVAERMAIFHLQQAGAPPEVVKDVLARFKATTQGLQARAKWYGKPAIAKAQQYEQDLMASFHDAPGAPTDGATPFHKDLSGIVNKQASGQQLTPEDQFKLNQVRAAEQKLTSDPATRQKLIASDEMFKRYNTIDPNTFDEISQFSGIPGFIQGKIEGTKAALREPVSQAFIAYRRYKKEVKGLTDQLRQVLGTSVRNQYVKTMLLPMVDAIDSTIGTNPQLAKAQWQWLGNWLQSYRGEYARAVEQGVPTSRIQYVDLVARNPNLQQTPPGFVKSRDGKFHNVKNLPAVPAPAPAAAPQAGQGKLKGSDGRMYSREELRRIHAGGTL